MKENVYEIFYWIDTWIVTKFCCGTKCCNVKIFFIIINFFLVKIETRNDEFHKLLYNYVTFFLQSHNVRSKWKLIYQKFATSVQNTFHLISPSTVKPIIRKKWKCTPNTKSNLIMYFNCFKSNSLIILVLKSLNSFFSFFFCNFYVNNFHTSLR